MNTIQLLEDCLKRECPAFHWTCASSTASSNAAATPAPAPQQIQIHATRGGAEVAGSPVFLSSDLLLSWGADSTARLISSQMKGYLDPAQSDDFEWDKLSEF